jgi:hypothetical protein
VTEACPENSKAGPEVTFNESSDKLEATDLEANLEATEVVLERKELRTEEANMNTIGSYEDRHKDRRATGWKARVKFLAVIRDLFLLHSFQADSGST